MIYAQIKCGIVRNYIVIDDATLVPLFLEGYDYCIRIDNLTPRPNIGWEFDGSSFYPAISPVRGVIKIKIKDATSFGEDLVADFAARNVEVNLNLLQVQYIMAKTMNIKIALEAGSLYVALDMISKLTPEPLLPKDVIDFYSNKIKRYLGLI